MSKKLNELYASFEREVEKSVVLQAKIADSLERNNARLYRISKQQLEKCQMRLERKSVRIAAAMEVLRAKNAAKSFPGYIVRVS
jgi:hypothetical protein